MTENDIARFINNTIIILDTNVLLYMYKCSFNTSQNIVELLNKAKDKITIPQQVYSEYLLHKDQEQAKIDKKYDNFTKELNQKVSKMQTEVQTSINESRKYEFPDCDELENNIINSVKQIQNSINAYQNSLNSEKGSKDNQISNVENLIDYFVDKNKICKEIPITKKLKYIEEAEVRFRYRMPPGYMDEAEKDKELEKGKIEDNFQNRIRKYGDFFVWKEILDLGKKNSRKKIVFITNDVKEDWWIIKGENKKPIKMREELFKEFVEITRNDSIEFLSLPDFYSLFSKYYKICDNKTQMELEMQNYANAHILTKHRQVLNEEIDNRIRELGIAYIDSRLIDYSISDCEIADITIKNVDIHFDDETAFYNITFVVNIVANLTKVNNNIDKSFCEKRDIALEINAEVQRDILDETDDDIKFISSEYNDNVRTNDLKLQFESELNGNIEIDKALEKNNCNH